MLRHGSQFDLGTAGVPRRRHPPRHLLVSIHLLSFVQSLQSKLRRGCLTLHQCRSLAPENTLRGSAVVWAPYNGGNRIAHQLGRLLSPRDDLNVFIVEDNFFGHHHVRASIQGNLLH